MIINKPLKSYISLSLILILTVTILTAYSTHDVLAAEPPPQASGTDEEISHPLDPLTAAEYEQVLALLSADELVDEETLYPIITLMEPDKAFVLEWQSGDDIPRAAFAIIKQGKQTFEAVVDLSGEEVASWEEIEGVQPSILLIEFFGVGDIVLADEDFVAAMAERGIEDVENLVCVPLSVGYFGLPEEEGHRVLRVPCFYFPEGENPFAKPIEGLHALVDLDTGEVLKVIDTGPRPVPELNHNYSEESMEDLREADKPTIQTQPEGANFTIANYVVEWQGWKFHYRLDKRAGLIVSDASYQQVGEEARSILYQGSISEVFVPYNDPDVGFYYRTFMDSGEYGFGLFATPLVAGIDCPETASFLDAVVNFDDGSLIPFEDVICVFERATGNPTWRHFEGFTGAYEGRTEVELVIRTISTVGNYDYLVDWVFSPNAKIKVAVGATGIDIAKGVATTHMDDDTALEDTAYGTLVAPNIVAPFHSHYFNFRLDMDVDGTDNSMMVTELTPTETPDSPRAGIWTIEQSFPQTESEAQFKVNLAAPKIWHVVNPNNEMGLGHNPSYVLMPKHSAAYSLLPDDDNSVQRAYFIQNHLWVTPYEPEEQNAAGLYVNQSHGGDGLPDWTSNNRPITNTDIVLWYTLGFHHVTMVEDWPVMSVHWFEFELMPFNFFNRNPAINLSNPQPVDPSPEAGDEADAEEAEATDDDATEEGDADDADSD